MLGDNWFAVAVGVCHKPDSVSSVRGIDGTSRNNNRPCGVSVAFHLSKHRVEAHRDVASNVLSQNDTGSRRVNNAAHLRPDVTVICRASSLPGNTERLAGVSSSNKVNWSELIASHVFHVAHDRDTGEVPGENSLAPGINLHEANGFPPHPPHGEGEAANAAEQVKVSHDAPAFFFASSTSA